MKKIGKALLIALGVLILVGALSSACSKSETKSASSASVDAIAPEESASTAAKSAESRIAEIKASILGTWDMTGYKNKDDVLSESELSQARKGGKDSYIVFNENGTADLVFANNVSSMTWDIKDADGKVMLLNEAEIPYTLQEDELMIGVSSSYMSFKKGEPRKSLPTQNSDTEEQSGQPEASSVPSEDSADNGEVSPDLKEALDSYEAFMDEYVEFMQKYQDSGDTMSMLSDYSNYMQKYLDFAQKIEDMDTSSMSAADYAYYIEVTSRVSQKLLSVSSTL